MNFIGNHRVLVYGGQNKNANILSDIGIFDLKCKKWIQPVNLQGKSPCGMPLRSHSASFLPHRKLLVFCFGAMNLNGSEFSDVDVKALDMERLIWHPPLNATGKKPSQHYGHTATFLPGSSNDEIVVFGGYTIQQRHSNSVSVLDTCEWVWSKPVIEGDPPKAQCYHSATAIPGYGGCAHDISGNVVARVVFFGGYPNNECTNEIHILEKIITGLTTSWRWVCPTVSGTSPSPCYGHSATLLIDKRTICIYGGYTDNGVGVFSAFGDSFLLDTETWSWKGGPSPIFARNSMGSSEDSRRLYHQAVLNTFKKGGNEIVVFGGAVRGGDCAGDIQTLTIPDHLLW
jgi:hypothetical protein